jgi:hypothetical protein
MAKKYAYRGYEVRSSQTLNNQNVVAIEFIMVGGSCTVNKIALRDGVNVPEALKSFKELQNAGEENGKMYDIIWNANNPQRAVLYVREKYWTVN